MKGKGITESAQAPILPILMLSLAAGFLGYWFRYYFTSQPLAAWDLPGHIAIVDRLRTQLLHGNIIFYDREWFGGWAAFQFYSFLPHLLAAIISWPLQLFAADPARLSVHTLLVIGTMAVPACLYFAAQPFACELLGDGFKKSEISQGLLALSAATVSFWFINHDDQWYGIGAAAPMHIGLFSQLFGWHFFLIHLGLLVRFLRNDSLANPRWLILSYAALWLTHTLTALFSAFLVLLTFLWWPTRRWEIVRPHLLALALTGFWTVPFIRLSPIYTGLDIHRPQGDLLQFLFRYPFVGLIADLRSWLHGKAFALNIGDLLIGSLVVLALVSVRVKAQKLWGRFFLFALFSVVVFSSGFVASSIPFGIHYYRFQAYIVLLIAVLLTVVPLVAFSVRDKTQETEGLVAPAFFALLLLGAFVSTTFYPHYERKRVISSAAPEYFSNEQKVLSFFSKEQNVGRVFFEYFTDDKVYPWLTPHFLESELFRRTGIESVGGLFIQSTVAYRMPAASFNLLGAQSYNIPLLFTDRASLDDGTKLKQLVDFGVTHLVAGKQTLVSRLRSLVFTPPVQIGPYYIFRLVDTPQPAVLPAAKQLVGVYDLRGNMPFTFVEYYCYARKAVFDRFELLSLSPDMPLPAEVKTIIVNGVDPGLKDGEVFEQLGLKPDMTINLIRLNYENPYTIDHYSVQYQHNVELDNYNNLERYLESTVHLPGVLQSLPEFPVVNGPDTAKLAWASADQVITLENLTPNQLYRINYSYFPFWRSSDGTLYRGSGEKMFFVPNGATAKLTFSKLRNPLCLAGWLLTLLGIYLFKKTHNQNSSE